MRKTCSSDLEELLKFLKFVAECREYAKNLISLEQFIQTVKGHNNIWLQNGCLSCFWRFIMSNKPKQLEFKWGKNGI